MVLGAALLITPLGQKVFALSAFVYLEEPRVGVMGIARDVTAYKQPEEALAVQRKAVPHPGRKLPQWFSRPV